MRLRFASIALGLVALAGCASTSSGSARTTTLTVHVGVFGGPELPDGQMAASNAPQSGASIAVTDAGGHTQRAKTDGSGVATFSVAPGRYAVRAPCDVGPQHVRVRSGHPAHVEVHCDVP